MRVSRATASYPPEVGYAEATSAMEKARQRAPMPAIIQHQMTAGPPPACRGKMKVVITVPKRPDMLRAKLKQDHVEKCLLNTYGQREIRRGRSQKEEAPGHTEKGSREALPGAHRRISHLRQRLVGVALVAAIRRRVGGGIPRFGIYRHFFSCS